MGIGTRVDIDFSQLDIDWLPGTAYTIQLGAGFVKEDGGEEQPSPANPNFFSFTTNASGPLITSITPVATTILVGIGQITFLFDRQISLSTGNIKLYRVASPDVLVKTYATSDSNISIGSNSSSIILELGNDINIADTEYYFLFDADVIRDTDNFASPAVVNANLYRYTSGTAPLLSSRTPADGASAVTPATFTLTFNQFVKKGTGFIKLINTASGQEVASLNVASSSAVTFDDTVVSVNFGTFILESNTGYHVTIGNNAILGLTGIPFAGLANSTDWNFTTAGAGLPDQFIETRLYTDSGSLRIRWPAQAGAGEQLTPTQDNLVNKTKGIKLYESNGTFVRAFYHGGTGQGTVSKFLNNAVEVFMSSYLQENKTYYVLIDAGAYYNANTNLLLPPVTDPNLIRFNTNFGLLNLQNATYSGNQNNDLFTVTTTNDLALVPKLLNNTQTYTIDLTSNVGRFSNGTSIASTYTISGTRNQLTNILANDVIFIPNKNGTGSGTITLVLKSGSTVLSTNNANITYSGTTVTLEPEVIYYTSSTTYTPTSLQLLYKNSVDIMLVGAGGGGRSGGGGGGSGGVVELFDQTLSAQTYTFTVGASGAKSNNSGGNASAGGNTTAFGQTAFGGTGASFAIFSSIDQDPGNGGTSGAPQSNTGYVGFTRTPKGGTVKGTLTTSTVQKQWGTASAYFDGVTGTPAASYLQMNSSTDYEFGTGDFTVETWVRRDRTNHTSTEFIVDTRLNGSFAGFALLIGSTTYNNNKLVFVSTFDGDSAANVELVSTGTLNANTWYHVAVTRTSGLVSIYINGSLQASGTDTQTYQGSSGPQPMYIGSNVASATFKGYMDDFRLTKGLSRYSGSSFSVPTSQLVNDQHTKLLLHFEGNFADDYKDPTSGGGGGAGSISTGNAGGSGLLSTVSGITPAGGGSGTGGIGNVTYSYPGAAGLGGRGSESTLQEPGANGIVYLKLKP